MVCKPHRACCEVKDASLENRENSPALQRWVGSIQIPKSPDKDDRIVLSSPTGLDRDISTNPALKRWAIFNARFYADSNWAKVIVDLARSF